MKRPAKQLCTLLAAAVSVCFLVCLVSTLRIFLLSGSLPSGMGMLTIVTALCTFIIWKGVREME